MKEQFNIIVDFEDLEFQIQMLSGIAFILWESLVKPEVTEEDHIRSYAAYFLYDQLEKFTSSFRNRIEKIAEQARTEE